MNRASTERVAYLASRRQQRATKIRQSMDDVIAALDRQHLGRVVVDHQGRVSQSATAEEVDMAMHLRKQEDPYREREARRALEEQVDQQGGM